jgi:hypothetical protein
VTTYKSFVTTVIPVLVVHADDEPLVLVAVDALVVGVAEYVPEKNQGFLGFPDWGANPGSFYV